MRSTTAAVAAVAVLALAAGGCGAAQDAITERVVDEATDGSVQIDLDGDETRIETGGSVLENAQGRLVDDFPDDVALPDGFDVQTSSAVAGRLQAFGTIPDLAAARTELLAALPDAGWEITIDRGDDTTFQIVATRSARELVYNASPANDDFFLTVVVDA